MNTLQRISFLGLPLDALDLSNSLDRCEQLILQRGTVHSDLNASIVNLARTDTALRDAIIESDLVNADGQSVVWAARLLRTPVPNRVSGIDLMQEILKIAPDRGYSVYLLGATPKVVTLVHELLEHQGVRVVGSQHGYWPPEYEPSIVARIAKAAPDILFIGMPSPQKELFAVRHRQELSTGLIFGVGGSFDVLAGVTKRAPQLLQRLGLEWLFRLSQEPRRLFRRYLVGNFQFIAYVLRERRRHRTRLDHKPSPSGK